VAETGKSLKAGRLMASQADRWRNIAITQAIGWCRTVTVSQHGDLVVKGYGRLGLGLSVLLLVLSSAALPQSSLKKSQSATSTASPHCSVANETVPASTRAQRDQFWNEGLEWLIEPSGHISDPGVGSIDLERNPLDVPGAVIVAATVGGYRTFSSALKPYVEATVCVDRVFGDWSRVAHPSTRQHITILAKGDWASDLSAPQDPYRLEVTLRPGRTYLVILTYHRIGDFYESYDSWDITDGIVRANTPVTKYQAEKGKSPLEGLTVQQLGPALSRLLSRPD
jgi:hypothetical protein